MRLFFPTKTQTVSNEINPFPLFSNCSNSKKAEMENRNRKLYFYCVDLDKQTGLTILQRVQSRPVDISSRQGA